MPCQDMNKACREVLLANGARRAHGGDQSHEGPGCRGGLGGSGVHGARGPCLFGDILGHVAGAADVHGGFLNVAALLGQLPLTWGAWCYSHCQVCSVPEAEVDVSGPPCTDFSPQGLRRGIQGPTMVAFLCWARLVCASTQLRLVVFENVPEFPQWLLEFAFASQFWLHRLHGSPEDCGFGLARRDRVYVLMVHKHRATLAHCPHELHQVMVTRMAHVQTRPCHALVAGPAEIHDEVLQLAMRRKVIAYGAAEVARITGVPGIRPVDVMNAREQDAVDIYNMLYTQRTGLHADWNPSLFYFLGDNPRARCSWSLHGRLPTLRTNAGLLWSPWARRFLTHRERFAVMGYPVYLELAAAMGVPGWSLPDSVAMRQVLGNAMHVACVSMMLLIGLSCVKPAH